MTDDPNELLVAPGTPGAPPPIAEEEEPMHDAPPIAEGDEPPATLEATLTVKRSGAETDVTFTIHPPATIGRFDPAVGPIDVDLGSMPEAAYVSRKHAKITHDGAAWMIEDLGSSNGTFLLQDGDFAKVEMAEITDGAEIALGNARFVFHIG